MCELFSCVLLVEFTEGEKLLMCVEILIVLAAALSMQHSLCSLEWLLFICFPCSIAFCYLEIQFAHVSYGIVISARSRGFFVVFLLF